MATASPVCASISSRGLLPGTHVVLIQPRSWIKVVTSDIIAALREAIVMAVYPSWIPGSATSERGAWRQV